MANRIEKLNGAQLIAKDSESWHNDYKDSAYIYIGGLPFTLTEGDIVCIFSQYGEPLDVNLIRDKQTGKSKGFAFLRYADQRSTTLAVDNLTGATVLGRALRVDHCSNYKQPKQDGDGQDYEQDPRLTLNVAPSTSEQTPVKSVELDSQFVEGLDPEDPMFAYLVQERKDKAEERAAKRKRHEKNPEKSRRHHRHLHRDESHTRSFES